MDLEKEDFFSEEELKGIDYQVKKKELVEEMLFLQKYQVRNKEKNE